MKAKNQTVTTDVLAAVTFDTLAAAKELRETGLDDRQAEAIVTTISKAMNETVATKADLELQSAATRADIEASRTATKADIETLRTATKADIQAVRSDMILLEQSFDSRFKSLEQLMVTLQDKIVIKLGSLMVTMTFLLLAIGPFYFRWVIALMGTG